MPLIDEYKHVLHDELDRLVNGQASYEQPRLQISPLRIEKELYRGQQNEDYLTILAPEGYETRGTVITYGSRVTFSTTRFSGRDIKLPFYVDTRGLCEGDVVKGEVCILSDMGEYVVPYVISLKHSFIESSVGPIKNLFHFTNLAQTDFDEATQIFYSDRFQTIFINNDRQFLDLYRGFSAVRDSKYNVEAFLVAVHKKNQITYSFSRTDFELEAYADQHESILVKKSSWGYSRLSITSDSDFIVPDRMLLGEEDFVGNTCELGVLIRYDKLHQGANYGKLMLQTDDEGYEIPFKVIVKVDGREKRKQLRREQALRAELARIYIDFRIHNITRQEWEGRTTAVVDRLLSISPNSIEYRLASIQVLISAQRKNEARDLLDKISSEGIESASPIVYGFYLYLRCLVDGDSSAIRRHSETIHSLYMENREKDSLLWMHLYTSEELQEDPSGRLIMVRHQCERGGNSPVLYLEAYHILAENPAMLSQLGSFEMAVMNFAIKTELFHVELTRAFVYLAEKEKQYSKRLYWMLCELYKEYKNSEILSAICSQLMKGQRTDEEAFAWYALAVDKELKITRLYEFYMYSIPEDFAKELPKPVQLYFSYSSSLSQSKSAVLYSNIISNYGTQISSMGTYESQIEEYGIKCLKQGVISPRLAVIYEYLKDKTSVREAIAESVATIAFMHRITVKDDRFKNLVVIENALRYERKCSFVNRVAYIPIYGKDYVLLCEDEQGRRFVPDEVVYDEILLDVRDYSYELSGYLDHIGVCIYRAEQNRHYVSVDGRNHEYVKKLVFSSEIRDDYKKEYRKQLLQYYSDQDMIQELDECILFVRKDSLPADERSVFLDFMVRRGMLRQAVDYIRLNGSERFSSSAVIKLVSGMISDVEEDYDQNLILALCRTAFKSGKYDEQVVTYLTDHFDGTSKAMRDIWKTALGYGIPVHSLEERLLTQMLCTRSFVGEREEIFESYIRGGALPVVENAWISKNAFDYMIKDVIMDEGFFDRLIEFCTRDECPNTICQLAFIRYFAEIREEDNNAEISDVCIDKITQFIKGFIDRRIIMECFLIFADYIPDLAMYKDRTFVEYKASNNSIVSLHYVLEAGEDEDSEYKTETMKNIHNGIFSKTFQLFFGESLQFYITETIGGKSSLTESLQIDKTDVSYQSSQSRYDVINDMLLYNDMHEEGSLLKLMDVYRRKKFVANNIFEIR